MSLSCRQWSSPRKSICEKWWSTNGSSSSQRSQFIRTVNQSGDISSGQNLTRLGYHTARNSILDVLCDVDDLKLCEIIVRSGTQQLVNDEITQWCICDLDHLLRLSHISLFSRFVNSFNWFWCLSNTHTCCLCYTQPQENVCDKRMTSTGRFYASVLLQKLLESIHNCQSC